jgi:hypothetical protein
LRPSLAPRMHHRQRSARCRPPWSPQP